MLNKDEVEQGDIFYFAIWNPSSDYNLALLTSIEIASILHDSASAKTKKVYVLAGANSFDYRESANHSFKYMFKTLTEAQHSLIEQIFKMHTPVFD